MKRIEMLADVKNPPGYIKGEVRLVPPEVAEHFCKQGWARDLSGEIKTGEPDRSEKTLDVRASTVGHRAAEPGVS